MLVFVERMKTILKQAGQGGDTSRAFTAIIGGPAQFNLILDWENGTKNSHGLGMLGGKYPNENETTVFGDEFGQSRPVRVECRVRRESVDVRIDGRDRIRWKGDIG